jgi:hypothetical protein
MHSNEIVLKILVKMIIMIVSEYPEQTMWSLIAVVRSSTTNRSFRGQEILSKLKVDSPKSLITEGNDSSPSRGAHEDRTTYGSPCGRTLEALQFRNNRQTGYGQFK